MKATQSTPLLRSHARRWAAVLLFILLWPPTVTVAFENPCGGDAQQHALKSSLQQTAIRVLEALERRDIASFVRYLSPRGVGFGVDKAPVPLDDVERQLRSKRGVYCLLFSTKCMAASNPKEAWKSDSVLSRWTISYSQWLRRNKPYKPEPELLDAPYGTFCGGLVTVHAAARSREGPDVMELQFNYESRTWILVNTPFELGP